MKLLAVAILLTLSTLVSAETKTNCFKFEAPLDGGYCVTSDPTSLNNDFVYHFHGSNGDQRIWIDDYFYTGQVRKFWSDNNFNAPTVISVSFGPTWLLAPKNSAKGSGLLEKLTGEIIPKIESSLGGLKGRRIVVGESMGGFNSVQLAFKTTLFKKAAILCAPMFTEGGPFSSDEEIKAIIQRSGASHYYSANSSIIFDSVKSAIALSREYYPSAAEWEVADPIRLASKADVASLPQLYVASGFYDQFLAYESNEEFVKILLKKGAAVEWRPQWGQHCAIDIPSLAHFLTN